VSSPASPETPDPAALREVLVEAGEPDPGPGLLAEPLSGGSSRELWALRGGGDPEPRWVLRRDPPGERPQTSRAEEFAVQRAAAEAGVPVPRPLALEPAGGRLGTAAIVMAWVAGEALPRRIQRDPALAGARERLAGELGAALAALRTVDLGALAVDVEVPADPAAAALAAILEMLDATGEALPALELGLRWLELNRPPPVPASLVHGDFRLGNFLVGAEGLRAVVDWEFWHPGDPAEDVAWVCARPWRFGADSKPVAGLGEREALLAGFGEVPDRARLLWWDVLSEAKWAAYCAQQATLRRQGAHRSLERTVLARRVAEAESDMLDLLEGAW
jgi:aminoglycoside phosphotransferase (APT) family kinase protein